MVRIGKFSKYAIGLILLAAPAGASYFPIVLSSAGPTASTAAVVVINQPTIANTTFGATQANAFNTVSTSTILNQPTALNVVSTGTAITQATALNVVSTATAITQATALNVVSSNTYATIIQPGSEVFAASVTFQGAQPVTQSGTWNTNSINNSTSTWDIPFPANGQVDAFIGPTGLTQAGRVTVSSDVSVNVIQTSFTANQGSPGTNDWPVRIATTTVIQGLPGTIDWPVRISTVAVSVVTATVTFQAPNNNTTPIPVSGSFSASTVNITTATPDTAFPIATQVTSVVGPTGLPQVQRVDITSDTYTVPQVLISSVATFPNALPNGSSTTIMSDPYGRIVVVEGANTGVILATSPVTALSGYMVLVATPSATLFTHVCGCIWRNSSPTTVSIDVCNTGNCSVSGTQDVPFLSVTAMPPVGLWPGSGCAAPFLNTTAGGVQISAKVSAAAATINGYCTYFQNQTP